MITIHLKMPHFALSSFASAPPTTMLTPLKWCDLLAVLIGSAKAAISILLAEFPQLCVYLRKSIRYFDAFLVCLVAQMMLIVCLRNFLYFSSYCWGPKPAGFSIATPHWCRTQYWHSSQCYSHSLTRFSYLVLINDFTVDTSAFYYISQRLWKQVEYCHSFLSKLWGEMVAALPVTLFGYPAST